MKLLLSIVFFSVLLPIFLGSGASATIEQAVNWCNQSPETGPFGALWLVNDRYSSIIEVDGDSSDVSVYLTGTGTSCGSTELEGARFYATNMHVSPESSRYLNINQADLFRGVFPKGRNVWASGGDYSKATLNVKNIVKDYNIKPGETGVVNVSVYRCARIELADGRIINGFCDYATVPINIKVKEKYQTKARSYIKTGNSNSDNNWGDASRKVKVQVGDSIYFKHTLENIGTNYGKVRVVVRGNDEYASSLGKSTTLQEYDNIPRSSSVFAQASPTNFQYLNDKYMSYRIKKTDAGKTLCSRIEFLPSSLNTNPIIDQYQDVNSHNIGYTKEACAFVSYDYDITTGIPIGGGCSDGDSCDREEEPGTPNIPVPIKINTPSKGVNIRPTNWKLTHYVIRPNANIVGKNTIKDRWGNTRNGGFLSGNGDPCSVGEFYNRPDSVYQPSESDNSRKIQGCSVINSGTIDNLDREVKVEGMLHGELGKFSIPESAEIGTKYCFALSISPYIIMPNWSESEQKNFNEWHHGEPACIIVVKKPKAQIQGAGLFANGGVYGLLSRRSINGSDRVFGSWVEYEIVSNDNVNRVASNGVFGYPNGSTGFAGGTFDTKTRNRLTFSNKSAPYGYFGENYSSKYFISKVESLYKSKKATSTTNNINISNNRSDALIKPTSKATISGVSVMDGDVVVFAPNQEVEISGDIIQTGGVRSLAESAQVIIIAKNVNIRQNVKRVDAWILADKMNTCSDVAISDLHAGSCNEALEINGVVALSGTRESLLLKRTAGSVGSGDGIGYPAETFRLNANVHQWVLGKSRKNGVKITTTYSKELPPRL